MPYTVGMERDTKAIRTACEVVEGQANLARLLRVSAPTVNEWVKGSRPVPQRRCPEIERVTSEAGRRVRCEDIHPGLDWDLLRKLYTTPTKRRRTAEKAGA